MSDADLPTPKIFISYSWTNPEHERWVLALATQLQNDEIEVILDKWDLKPGQDKYVFMEKMVRDPSICKVLLICDLAYAEKADGRKGGVGDETQIVTSKVYGAVDQEKFIPIIAERDEDGREHLPTYLSPRMYIDLSNTANYGDEYERLVRNIYGKPEHVKPPLGRKPAYILDNAVSSRSTATKFRAFHNAISTAKPHIAGSAEDYLAELSLALQACEVSLREGENSTGKEMTERIKASIDAFLPYRDEFIQFMQLICRYGGNDTRLFDIARKFFFSNSWLMYKTYKPGVQIYEDVYRFLLPELFLYATATLLNNDRYKEVAGFLGASYPSSAEGRHSGSMDGYTIFSQPLTNINQWNPTPYGYSRSELDTRWFLERANHKEVTLVDLTDADFILLMRDALHTDSNSYGRWYPSLVKAQHHSMRFYTSGFPTFARAAARDEFKNLALLLDVNSKTILFDLLKTHVFKPIDGRAPNLFGMSQEIIERYMQYHNLGTR
ncbi:MAG: SEFIR domain-containing protein [Armatimonadota bacterium]